MHIVIGFLAALLVFSLIRYGINSSPKQRRQLAYIIAIGLAAGVLLLLLLTGRVHFLAALVAALIPFAKKLPLLLRYFPLLRHLKQQLGGAKKVGPEDTSTVVTSLLAMSLQQRSGRIDGEVLLGEFKGQRLTQLSLSQLFQLYQVASDHYVDSIPVLDAFLKRHVGIAWRKKAEQLGFQFDELNMTADSPEMDVSRALQILGLEPGASKQEVLDAHRKLMQKLHPDRGGSNFLAAQVNTAKDVLLESIKKN